MKNKVSALSPLAREMAEVQSGKIAPGRVWIVKRRSDGTVERRQVSRVMYKRKCAADSAAQNTALPARRAMGVSQDRFAELLGISAATVRNIEQGRTKPAGPTSTLLRIAEHHPEIFIAHKDSKRRAVEAMIGELASHLTSPEKVKSGKTSILAMRPLTRNLKVKVASKASLHREKKPTTAAKG